MRAIVVDDEPKIRNGLCGLVEGLEGWTVAGSFEDAPAAMEYLRKGQADVIITDIKMPRMSGLDLIYKIREVNTEVDVVIVSGYTNFSYAQRAIELGVTRYLTKPTNPMELIDTLRQIEKKLGRSAGKGPDRAGQPDRDRQPGNQLIVKAQEYIASNYSRKITLKDMADELYISPNYLCELFKRHTNKNLTDYISAYRIDRAKELLMDIRYRVNDVAYMVGFSDSQYFSNLFKKKVGMTPTEYRNKR
ncbi:MAG: response regulator [Clostridia bacterium]|nr:response regulator [Clostridia bacterium]